MFVEKGSLVLSIHNFWLIKYQLDFFIKYNLIFRFPKRPRPKAIQYGRRYPHRADKPRLRNSKIQLQRSTHPSRHPGVTLPKPRIHRSHSPHRKIDPWKLQNPKHFPNQAISKPQRIMKKWQNSKIPQEVKNRK